MPPASKASYDLVVIGTGTATMVAATRVRAAGWRVAVVDFRPFGGTCALRGCDPKKMLIGAAAAIDHGRRMHGKGVAGDTRIDWPELMAFKRSFTDPIPRKHKELYAAKEIHTFEGRAKFTGPRTLDIDGARLEARHVLIAMGAEPVPLGIAGEKHLARSEDFLELAALPERIVLVGGGYIAAEFSHIAARAGAKVTVLQRAGRMLTGFDPGLVDLLMEKFRGLGIDVRTRTKVEAVEKAQDGFSVRATSAGQSIQLEADLVVHAAGRKPELEALNLGAANLAVRDGKLELNDYLQSASNPAVHAAGDAAQKGPPLTPVSGHDAKVAAANLLEGNHLKPDYLGVPSVAFTIPPIAAVGLGEIDARERGLKFRVQQRKASDWFTARQAAEPVYGFKVLVEERTERILAYPTGASDIGYML